MNYQLSRHAEEELIARGIPSDYVTTVLEAPDSVILQEAQKCIYQKSILFSSGKYYLVRVIVALDKQPPKVITVYRTSKFDKYQEP
jgi:hypothetical protein